MSRDNSKLVYKKFYFWLRLFYRDNVLSTRRISFKHTAQIWNACYLAGKEIDDAMFTSIIKRKVVSNRLGRMGARAIKKRPKTYKVLIMPRAEAKQNILANGHFKKVK